MPGFPKILDAPVNNTRFQSPLTIKFVDRIPDLVYYNIMSKSRQSIRQQAIKRSHARRGERRIFSLTVLILLVGGLLLGFRLFNSGAEPETPAPASAATQPDIQIAAPQANAAPAVEAVTVPNDLPHSARYSGLVGLVSGHRGYDPGAACPDGLTEAEVNYAVALEVANLLQRRGVQVDILDEFDERLTEYQADALVSIHADSCSYPGMSGFKVARITASAIPEAEDALVACLNQEYAAYTGLPQHPASITDGMTNYHAFREIADHTPGAIIETGFLLDDRELLERRPKVVARGVAAGILCFLDYTAAGGN
ncbi:MAG: hypothetical protein Kow0031_25070 [Anaerolineae bacterium]